MPDMKEIISAPEFRKLLADRGQVPVATPPVRAIQSYIKAEQDKWGVLVEKLGLKGSQ